MNVKAGDLKDRTQREKPPTLPAKKRNVRKKARRKQEEGASLHLSGRWLSGSPIIWIGLVLPVNLSGILQN